jgi:hypothetical protein
VEEEQGRRVLNKEHVHVAVTSCASTAVGRVGHLLKLQQCCLQKRCCLPTLVGWCSASQGPWQQGGGAASFLSCLMSW